MPTSGGSRRVRVARGIYQQPNGKYAVCVRVDGRARFRTVEAATLIEAVRQRELLQRVGQLGDLPLSPRLTFAEIKELARRDRGKRIALIESKRAQIAQQVSSLRLADKFLSHIAHCEHPVISECPECSALTSPARQVRRRAAR